MKRKERYSHDSNRRGSCSDLKHQSSAYEKNCHNGFANKGVKKQAWRKGRSADDCEDENLGLRREAEIDFKGVRKVLHSKKDPDRTLRRRGDLLARREGGLSTRGVGKDNDPRFRIKKESEGGYAKNYLRHTKTLRLVQDKALRKKKKIIRIKSRGVKRKNKISPKEDLC